MIDQGDLIISLLKKEVARPQNFIMGNEETELELSVESRSFANRVNHQGTSVGRGKDTHGTPMPER